jgi:hypothetical protein
MAHMDMKWKQHEKVLQAMHMASPALDDVSATTAHKCFNKAVFNHVAE